MMKQDKAYSLRLPLELVERIEKQADKEMRSVSNLIRVALVEYLDRNKIPEKISKVSK